MKNGRTRDCSSKSAKYRDNGLLGDEKMQSVAGGRSHPLCEVWRLIEERKWSMGGYYIRPSGREVLIGIQIG